MEDDLIFFLPLNDQPTKNTKYIKYVSDFLYIRNKLERTTSCDNLVVLKAKKILHLDSVGILMTQKKRVKFNKLIDYEQK